MPHTAGCHQLLADRCHALHKEGPCYVTDAAQHTGADACCGSSPRQREAWLSSRMHTLTVCTRPASLRLGCAAPAAAAQSSGARVWLLLPAGLVGAAGCWLGVRSSPTHAHSQVTQGAQPACCLWLTLCGQTAVHLRLLHLTSLLRGCRTHGVAKTGSSSCKQQQRQQQKRPIATPV